MLETLPVGVCALGPADEILVWNRAMQDLTGLQSRDWLGHGLEELPEPVASLFAESTPGERRASPHERPFSIGERTLAVQVSSSPLEDGGRVLMVEDMTERRRLERQVAHQDRLRSLGRLTAAIGHEIGNPLTGILMLARNLASEDEPEDLADRLALIVSEAEKIESIVRAMSAYARAGSENALVQASPRSRAVAVLETVEDALRLVRIAKKDRRMLWGYDCDPAFRVWGDKQQLTQVLVNLLTNACDASPPGRRVQVSARARGAEWLEVDVIDEGDGMPEHVAARIFEPFFTTKGPGSGTGLGLAVTDGIVRAHGGRVEVRSRPGEGTMMRIFLRRAPSGPAAGETYGEGDVRTADSRVSP